MSLLPCPNPECLSEDVHSDDVREVNGCGLVFVCCAGCECRGPHVKFVSGRIEEAEPEAVRLWNLLPRNDMRLVDRVNELVQAEEALNEENVRLQCELDDLREELGRAREEPWIAVSERLPETDDWCEVYEGDGTLTLAKWDPVDELWDWIRGGQLEPTHWRKWQPRRP